MDSLNPESPAADHRTRRADSRIWKFWGTALWGLFIFAGMFVGQFAVIGVLLGAAGRARWMLRL